jgi:hypothetical protein
MQANSIRDGSGLDEGFAIDFLSKRDKIARIVVDKPITW